MRKLNYRVVFPFELKLRNTSDDCSSLDDCYDLFAVVVHVGQGPNHGEFSESSMATRFLLESSDFMSILAYDGFWLQVELCALIDVG